MHSGKNPQDKSQKSDSRTEYMMKVISPMSKGIEEYGQKYEHIDDDVQKHKMYIGIKSLLYHGDTQA